MRANETAQPPSAAAASPTTPSPAVEAAHGQVRQGEGGQDEERIAVPGELLLHFLVGALIEGSEDALRRLRRWDADARRSSSLPTAADGLPDDHRVRWMLLGLLFETQAEAWYLVSRLQERRRRALRRRMEALQPITEWLPAGLVRRLEELRVQGRARGERWRRGGYLAEQEGRRLARYAAQAATDELLGYLARDPQIRALIEQQSLGVASEAVGDMRVRAASADAWIEHLAHAILRRAPSMPAPAAPPRGVEPLAAVTPGSGGQAADKTTV